MYVLIRNYFRLFFLFLKIDLFHVMGLTKIYLTWGNVGAVLYRHTVMQRQYGDKLCFRQLENENQDVIININRFVFNFSQIWVGSYPSLCECLSASV